MFWSCQKKDRFLVLLGDNKDTQWIWAGAVVAWYLSIMWISRYIWFPKEERLTQTERYINALHSPITHLMFKECRRETRDMNWYQCYIGLRNKLFVRLFSTPLYEGTLLGPSLLLNRTRKSEGKKVNTGLTVSLYMKVRFLYTTHVHALHEYTRQDTIPSFLRVCKKPVTISPEIDEIKRQRAFMDGQYPN